MKSAEDWANETCWQFDKMPTNSELIPVLKQIQLDAWKQGMSDAAAIATEGAKEFTGLQHNDMANACMDVRFNIEDAILQKESV